MLRFLNRVVRIFGLTLQWRRVTIDVTPPGAEWREYRAGPRYLSIRRVR